MKRRCVIWLSRLMLLVLMLMCAAQIMPETAQAASYCMKVGDSKYLSVRCDGVLISGMWDCNSSAVRLETYGGSAYLDSFTLTVSKYSTDSNSQIIYPITQYYGGYSATACRYYTGNNPCVSPEMMVDGSTLSSWDSCNDYEGAWFRLDTRDRNRYIISGFSIMNGKCLRNGSDEYYWKNARIKECRVYVDGVYAGAFTLNDTNRWQSVTFANPLVGSSVRVEVVSVYTGSMRYRSSNYGVCVTEVKLY